MAENAHYTIAKNDKLARAVYLMRLEGDTSAFTAPGQFVNIKVPDFYLRRPISVCRWDKKGFDIIYKVVGDGTAQMAAMRPGERLDLLVGLGRGYDIAAAKGRRVVLVGGGVGTPPLYGLAAALCRAGEAPAVVLGFASEADLFFEEEFKKLGCAVHIATEDGSCGTPGFCTGPLAEVDYDYYFACGPTPMLKAVYQAAQQRGAEGQLSFEERMGCGFGACMGCSCQTLLGPKRVCVDGPVFFSREVMFQ